MTSIAAVTAVSCLVAKFCNVSEDEILSELRLHLYCYSPLGRISGRNSKSKYSCVGNSENVNANGRKKTKLDKIRSEVEAALKRKENKGRAVVLKKGLLGAFNSDENSSSSSCDGSFTDEGSSDDTECSPEPSYPGTIDVVDECKGTDTTDLSALRYAAKNNNYPALLCGLRSNKYDPNDVDPVHGQSPLHLAADGGYVDCVALLLESGADPNCSDKDGMSVLQAAVLGRSVTVARMLLEYGANPDHYDMDGDSPRMLATEIEEDDTNGHEMRDLFMREYPPIRSQNSWSEYSKRNHTRHDSCSSVLSAIHEDEELIGKVDTEHIGDVEVSYKECKNDEHYF